MAIEENKINLLENLERYIKYADGDESCAGGLFVGDESGMICALQNDIDASEKILNIKFFKRD